MKHLRSRIVLAACALFIMFAGTVNCSWNSASAQESQTPNQQLRDLNSYFPFSPPEKLEDWESRKKELRNHLRVSLGLWPYPSEPKLKPVIHGLIDKGDYTIEKVYFEILNGLHVTGVLYKPKNIHGKVPGILSPHGHFRDGRFGKNSDAVVDKDIAAGAETFRSNARNKLQTRSANLAKMGCVVFLYDMLGFADSQQIGHGIAHGFRTQRPDMIGPKGWGLFSPQAEAHFQNIMGIQTWTSIRALDFLESLDEVDSKRIGVTGASGGGTQTFILCALDDRPAAAFPAVMVSTAMQGGCTCENCCHLRIGTGNVEIAAMFAPKPLGLTAANDWTKEMETKGFPELKQLYSLYEKPENVELTARIEFGHNYNQVSREAMYRWFKKHLKFAGDPTETEIDYIEREQFSVYDEKHPRPEGGADFEKKLLVANAMVGQKSLTGSLYSQSNKTTSKTPDDLIGPYVSSLMQMARRSEGEYRSIGKMTQNPEGLEWGKVSQFLIKSKSHPTGYKICRLTEERERGVIFVCENGASVFEKSNSLHQLAGKLTSNGFGVTAIEHNIIAEEFRTKSQRVNNNREALGYTFGYNSPPLLRRAYAWRLEQTPLERKNQFVVATDLAALEVGLNARWLNQSGKIAGIVVDTNGFRFQNLEDIRDPNLLPGAAKYFDLPGLLSLAAPTPMLVIGEDEKSARIIKRAYDVSGKSDQVTFMKKLPADRDQDEVIFDWIARQAK